MGRSHAKNNTTQSTLTYYERSLLRKEGAARRIGHDSMKPLDSCYLCLSRVSDPVACPSGHIYCRECCVANLISQKAEIAAKEREIASWEEREKREGEERRKEARERVVRDFEKGMALGGGGGRGVARERSELASDDSKVGSKFQLEAGAVERLAAEAEERAMGLLRAEQAEARKAKLAAFWLPSMTPEAKAGAPGAGAGKDVKLQTLCHMGGTPHPLSRKTLLPVILTYPPASTSKPICPSCSKELSNSTSSVLLSSRSPLVPTPAPAETNGNGDAEDGRPKKKQKKEKKEKDAPLVCGHVVCQTCADTIVKPQGRCSVCEAKVENGGVIPLGKEGTGFAAAGGAEVKKATTAFRV
ncbi:hypothetical protein IAT38_002638 [Cryptococcus sp. DSM 104549]